MRQETREIILLLFFYVVTAIGMTMINSCSYLNEPIHFVDPDIIDQQPIVIDTLPVDTIQIGTCVEYTEYTTPEFVGLFVKFDFPVDSILWEGGGISSYDLGEVISHITTLPFEYGTSPIGAWVIIEGTNDHKAFELKLFTRTFTEPIYRSVDQSLLGIPNLIPPSIVNTKWYFGTGRQMFMLPGIQYEKYIYLINRYPSYAMFSFYGVTVEPAQEVSICSETLKNCHKGRDYADLFYAQSDFEQSLVDSFYLAKWKRVRIH